MFSEYLGFSVYYDQDNNIWELGRYSDDGVFIIIEFRSIEELIKTAEKIAS